MADSHQPILSGSDYLALPDSATPWVIEDLLPVGGGLLLYGDPKVGKSYAALQLASALSSGASAWLGFAIPQAVPVVYVQLDTPRSLWKVRVQQLAASGHPVRHVHQADRLTLQTFPFDILNPDHFRLLSLALQPIQPGVVVIDTIREAHSAEENDSTAMQKVVSHLEAAVKPAALVYVAHARKSNPEHGYDIMGDARGSNYLVGKVDGIARFSHSSMRCVSRTIEEHTVKITREDDGFWSLAEDPFKGIAEQVLQDHPNLSTREHARILAAHPNVKKNEEACRAYLRRLKSIVPGARPSRG